MRAHADELGRRVRVAFHRDLAHYPWRETTWRSGALASAFDAGEGGTCVQWDDGSQDWISDRERIEVINDDEESKTSQR